MKIALLHRMFALLLAVGLTLGPVTHAAFAEDHCIRAAMHETSGGNSSDESGAAHSFGASGDCEDHSQLCSSCFPWAASAAHVSDAAPEDQLATLALVWRHDQSRILRLHHANSARGPPLA